MQELFKTLIETNVQIFSGDTKVVDKSNAIHVQNMALAIARGLANSSNGSIFKMKLGNQGTYVGADGQIIFKPAIVSGVTADLYNPTYVEIVDDSNANVGSGNSVAYTSIPNSTSSRVIVTCVISPNEAINRPTDTADTTSSDGLDGVDATPTEGQYFFDELGLFTNGIGQELLNDTDEMMLTHLIFSPFEHTRNREITIIYSLTCTVS